MLIFKNGLKTRFSLVQLLANSFPSYSSVLRIERELVKREFSLTPRNSSSKETCWSELSGKTSRENKIPFNPVGTSMESGHNINIGVSYCLVTCCRIFFLWGGVASHMSNRFELIVVPLFVLFNRKMVKQKKIVGTSVSTF